MTLDDIRARDAADIPITLDMTGADWRRALWQVAADRRTLLAEVDWLTAERAHYIAGCVCPKRAWCVPHGWAGTDPMHHRVCADHDHVDPAPTPPTEHEPCCACCSEVDRLDAENEGNRWAYAAGVAAERARIAEAVNRIPPGLDSHRYRCCGNGVVAPVAEWLGWRLADYFAAIGADR